MAKLVAWIDVHELGDGASFDLPGVVMWKYEAPGRYGIWDLALSHEMLIPNSRYYAADERVEITGSAGVLWVNGCTSRLTQEAPLQLYRDGHLTAYHDLPADWGVSFVASSRHFCESILAGIQPDLDAEEARAIQKLAWAAEASSREGRAIVLDEFHPE